MVEHLTFNQVVRGSNPRCLMSTAGLRCFFYFLNRLKSAEKDSHDAIFVCTERRIIMASFCLRKQKGLMLLHQPLSVSKYVQPSGNLYFLNIRIPFLSHQPSLRPAQKVLRFLQTDPHVPGSFRRRRPRCARLFPQVRRRHRRRRRRSPE